jgi:hypothetical protein
MFELVSRLQLSVKSGEKVLNQYSSEKNVSFDLYVNEQMPFDYIKDPELRSAHNGMWDNR